MKYIFCLAVVFITFPQLNLQAKKSPVEVIAYYTGDGQTINNYPVEKLTHIIYSFLHLNGDTIAFSGDAQRNTLRQLTALKEKYPSLKVMISLGGWGGCETCSPVFSKDSSRKHFASSVVRLLKAYNADGIDLDWEYPTIPGYPGHAYAPEDKDNFTALLKVLREQMGTKYELSFAAGGTNKFLEHSVDWKAIMPYLDRVNLMNYDLVSGYSTVTGHHTALYSTEKQAESTDNCVQYLLKIGIDPGKLVIGAAFYARVWENVSPVSDGLYQAGTFKEGVNYKHFDKKLSPDSGWMHYHDNKAVAGYAYNPSRKMFATYDDNRSIQMKVAYVQKHHLKGIMFWQLMDDRFKDGRLDALYEAIK